MSVAALIAKGLQQFDSRYDEGSGSYGHLPVVMDFQIQPAASLAIRIDVAGSGAGGWLMDGFQRHRLVCRSLVNDSVHISHSGLAD